MNDTIELLGMFVHDNIDTTKLPTVKKYTKGFYSGKWYIEYYIIGQSKPKRTKGIMLKREAELGAISLIRNFDSSKQEKQYEPEEISIPTYNESLTTLYEECVMELYNKKGLTQSSYLGYKDIWNLYLSKYYGKNATLKDINKNKAVGIKQFISSLRVNENYKNEKSAKRNRVKKNKEFSNSKKREIFRINKLYIHWLYINNYIDCDFTKDINNFRILKKENDDDEKYWIPTEYSKFVACVEDDAYKIFYTIMYSAGARRGEVLALRFSDIDFSNNTIHINRQFSVRTKVFSSPKWGSLRTIVIPKQLVELLERWKKMSEHNINMYGDECLLFSRMDNFPLSHTTLERKFKNAISKSGCEKIKMHALRSSYITNAIAMGSNPSAVAKQVGHKDVTITMNVYLKSKKEDKIKVATITGNINTNMFESIL